MAKKIHFIGIGGIGMSALAQLYVHRGNSVFGSDRGISEAVKAMLSKKGITVSNHAKENITPDIDLVVYTDAVVEGSEGYIEREAAVSGGIQTLSYFEALGEVAKEYRVVAISGTHGKTTTTGMVGKILIDGGKSPTIVVGSIITDFGSNFVPGTSDILVVEADEYRKHFLNFTPTVLVINNVEHDHTDFYPTFDSMKAAFRELAAKVPKEGTIVTNPGEDAITSVLEGAVASVVPYPTESVPPLLLIGSFNENNARASKAAAKAICPDLTDSAIDASLSRFRGSWRRFEYKGTTSLGAEVYDDYAHHPSEIAATIKGVRERFPDKQIVVAFHPHLFSRTKDLFSGFVEALSSADRVVLAPIFPAREPDTGEVSSDMLAEAIAKKNPQVQSLHSFKEIEEELQKSDGKDLLITMGAGDIYKVAEAIAKGC